MYSTITAKVVDQTLTILDVPKLASGGENEIRVEVNFDNMWSGYGKTAIFYRKENQVYHVVMTDGVCVIPREVLTKPGRLYFGVMGASGSSVRTTEVVALNVVQGAITVGVAEPLPDVYKQVLAAEGKNEQAIAVERARIDNLVAGGTVGDAELVDVRVDMKGNTFANAGAAVRAATSVQADVLDSAMTSVYLSIDYEIQTGMGFATNASNQAKLVANSGTNLYRGTVADSGYYSLAGKTLLALSALNDSTYTDYIYYETEDKVDVYIEAGTLFYVLGVASPPRIKTTYLPEQIVTAVSPDEDYYGITNGTEIEHSVMEGLLSSEKLQINSGRYVLYGYPVSKGGLYRLRCTGYTYPSDVYQLFGFVKTMNLPGHLPYIKSGVRANAGDVDILLRAPVDGYLVVSNDSAAPAALSLVAVKGLTLGSYKKLKAAPYSKMLTIGDSLSGNTGLWQPTVINLLNIPEYGVLGGAGLTVADQGAGVNTIYNRVMAMEAEDAVDLITFWGGFNDFNSAIPLSSMSEQLDTETRDATTFYGGLLDCVEKILSTYPLKQIVVVGTTPFNVSGAWKTKKNSLGLTIEDYVAAVREVADYYSLPFLDLLHTSGFNEYNYSTYYLDQNYWLHPNATGNALIGRRIAGFVKNLNGEY